MPEFLLQLIACYFCYASAILSHTLLLVKALRIALIRQIIKLKYSKINRILYRLILSGIVIMSIFLPQKQQAYSQYYYHGYDYYYRFSIKA